MSHFIRIDAPNYKVFLFLNFHNFFIGGYSPSNVLEEWQSKFCLIMNFLICIFFHLTDYFSSFSIHGRMTMNIWFHRISLIS